jgi:hypothetical protein
VTINGSHCRTLHAIVIELFKKQSRSIQFGVQNCGKYLTPNWIDLGCLLNHSMTIGWNLLKFESCTVTHYYYRWQQSSSKLDDWVNLGEGKILVMWQMPKVLRMGWNFGPEPQMVNSCGLQKIRVIGALEVSQLEGVFQWNLKILWRLWHWCHKSEILRDALDVFGWPKCECSGQLHEWKVLGRKLLFRGEACGALPKWSPVRLISGMYTPHICIKSVVWYQSHLYSPSYGIDLWSSSPSP